MRVGRILLLLSLLGVIFAFVKSEQFGGGTTKITSLDYSSDGNWLAVGQNHAFELLSEDDEPYLGNLSRSVYILDTKTLKPQELIRESLPIDRVGDPEWLRILGQLPNYESVKLPFSPVQFLPESKKLAFYRFETNSVDAIDIASRESEPLCAIPQGSDFTLGWFRVVDDEISVIIEGKDLELARFLMKDGKLDEQLPLGRPFYSDSVQLSLGPFVPVRMLPTELPLPSPTYGVALHPERDELAIGSVLQIVQVDFAGQQINKLYNKMKIGSFAVYVPNGQKILTLFHNFIRVIDVDKLEAIGRTAHEDEMITALAMSPDSKRFATGDNAGVVRVWDTDTAEMISKLRMDGAWKLDWRVPYALGFAWALVAFLMMLFRSSPKHRFDFETRPAGSSS